MLLWNSIFMSLKVFINNLILEKIILNNFLLKKKTEVKQNFQIICQTVELLLLAFDTLDLIYDLKRKMNLAENLFNVSCLELQ